MIAENEAQAGTEINLFQCDTCRGRTNTLLTIRFGSLDGAIQNPGEVCWRCFLGWCADYNVPVPPSFPRLCNDPDHV